ncbi:hypothetical protein DL770_009233 [Monosporascus sp. CRB-9-2]|nr:hypothetical protein DL770_009233 [Monosporascus sp. CRB-9-2]
MFQFFTPSRETPADTKYFKNSTAEDPLHLLSCHGGRRREDERRRGSARRAAATTSREPKVRGAPMRRAVGVGRMGLISTRNRKTDVAAPSGLGNRREENSEKGRTDRGYETHNNPQKMQHHHGTAQQRHEYPRESRHRESTGNGSDLVYGSCQTLPKGRQGWRSHHVAGPGDRVLRGPLEDEYASARLEGDNAYSPTYAVSSSYYAASCSSYAASSERTMTRAPRGQSSTPGSK